MSEKSFEHYQIEETHGIRVHKDVYSPPVPQQEVQRTRENLELIVKTTREILNDKFKLFFTDRVFEGINESEEIFPLTDIHINIDKNLSSPSGTYRKLTLPKEWLLPELAEQFKRVTAEISHVEVDINMFSKLPHEKANKILRTLARWETVTGYVLRIELVVGRSK